MAAVFNAPVNRDVATVSVGFSVSITSATDATGALYVDGVLAVTLSKVGNDFTGTWTPSSSGASKSLTFVGNVTGTSAAIIVTVDAANTVNQTMTAWTQSNTACTVAGSVTPPRTGATVYLQKPSASGSARRLFFTSPSGAGTIFADGFEIWAGLIPGSVTKVLAFNDGVGIGTINVETEETAASNMYTAIVERKTVNGILWKRIQFVRLDSASSNGTSCFFDLAVDVTAYLTSTTYTLAAPDLAGSGMYLTLPRRIDDVKLPFSIDMQFSAYLDAAASSALAVTGAQQWWYKARNVDTETNMAGGIGGLSARVIHPTGWSNNGTYPVLLFLKAQTDSADTSGGGKTTWQTATIDDYANTYNCVVVVIDERPSEGYWAGVKSNGSKDMNAFYPRVLMPWLQAVHGVSSSREDHLIIGWSKGGNAAVDQILEYPDVWGYAGAWDAAYLNAYPGNNANISYDNSTVYNAHDPAQILTSKLASVSGRKRLSIRGGHTWNTDLASFTAQLTSNNIKYDYNFNDPGAHQWGPTGFNGGWTPAQVAAMFTMRAAQDRVLTVTCLAMTITGQNTLLKRGRRVKVTAASYSITGQNTAYRFGKRIKAVAAAFAIQCFDVILTYTPTLAQPSGKRVQQIKNVRHPLIVKPKNARRIVR